ncbi:MAG TPA: hypothetical protein VD966_09645 [Pyrinomonadaceae bacterium]|nr:hypothetical protein [Pyrinomonadaceae bacterium]
MSKFLWAALLLTLVTSVAPAQRPRSVNDPEADAAKPAPPPPAPPSVKAKYEGGIFGYNRKIDGTLSFDDMNERLVFRNKNRQEVLHLPYDSVMAAFADTQSKRPVAASIAGSVWPYGLPALLIKKKYRYLTIQFNDPDTRMSGTTSFKLENKDILASVLNTLAGKAGLSPRGEGYIRRKDRDTTKSDQQTSPGP